VVAMMLSSVEQANNPLILRQNGSFVTLDRSGQLSRCRTKLSAIIVADYRS
jgi:hypothetical protein